MLLSFVLQSMYLIGIQNLDWQENPKEFLEGKGPRNKYLYPDPFFLEWRIHYYKGYIEEVIPTCYNVTIKLCRDISSVFLLLCLFNHFNDLSPNFTSRLASIDLI